MSNNHILNIEELGKPEIAAETDSVELAREAIMFRPELQDIVLGPADGSRITRCRYDPEGRAIYPAFRVKGNA